MSGSWMLAFGGQNRGDQNSEMRRGARSEYEAQMHGGEGSQAEGGELAHLHKYVKKLAQRLLT